MDLSVLIAARNEMFLSRTIKDVLSHAKADTEVIAVLDGAWTLPGHEPVEDHPRVTLIHRATSIGQRAAINEAARCSAATYIMKLDAHCSLDDGFDVKLIQGAEALGPDVTQIARMFNLHAFDWLCMACQHRTYQGPTPSKCEKCGSKAVARDILWKPRQHKRTDFARFDRELHFQYWREYEKRPEAKGDYADTMTSVGAMFFMRRDRFWQQGGLDEAHGSWGQFGVEVALKAWLSGGRHVVNKKTWFAHMFRTQGGDFGFPYPLSGSAVERARKHSRHLWQGGAWPQAVRSLQWVIDKFSPVPDWHNAPAVHVAKPGELTKGMVYYSDCRGDARILEGVRARLDAVRNGHKLVSVTLEPVSFGRNFVLPLERGYLTMFRQILRGLEELDTDIAYLVEHDVFYAKEHFEFVPSERDVFYYNQNVWKVDATTGQALHYRCSQTSGLCAYRDTLLDHYRARVARVEREGFNRKMGFEPGTHALPRGVDNRRAKTWMSSVPNVDIRHGHNLTPSRWKKEQFRNQKYTEGWTESDSVPGWGRTLGNMPGWIDAQSPR